MASFFWRLRKAMLMAVKQKIPMRKIVRMMNKIWKDKVKTPSKYVYSVRTKWYCFNICIRRASSRRIFLRSVACKSSNPSKCSSPWTIYRVVSSKAFVWCSAAYWMAVSGQIKISPRMRLMRLGASLQSMGKEIQSVGDGSSKNCSWSSEIVFVSTKWMLSSSQSSSFISMTLQTSCLTWSGEIFKVDCWSKILTSNGYQVRLNRMHLC